MLVNEREPHDYQTYLTEREHRKLFPHLYVMPVEQYKQMPGPFGPHDPTPYFGADWAIDKVQSGRERLGE